MSQQRLFEFRMGERSPDTLVVTEANRDAARLLTAWRDWPGGVLGLIGPAGAGKTHLGLAWALETGARQVPPGMAPDAAAALYAEAGGRLFLDDADSAWADVTLWRLLDLAREGGGALLLAAETPPAAWAATTPDLRSRLAALPVARLGEPDGALLEVVLRRFCREQFIHLRDDAAKYLALRMPRTFAAARELVGAIEAELAKPSRPVTIATAKKALERAQARWAE